MAAQFVPSDGGRAEEASVPPRSLLRSKVAELGEAECGEVVEYIEVMQSLRRGAADRRLFGDGLVRRVAAMGEGEGRRRRAS